MGSVLNRFLDRTVAFSFDRTGFRRHQRHFEDEAERSLQRILVTGGTDGIGLAVVEACRTRKAAVDVWARNPEKARKAEAVGARFQSVDLGDLDQVAQAAREVQGPLAGIVLNAGAMPLERKQTPQGHELIWASQVLGHLLLLRILRERGLLNAQSRVIWVSSGGMYLAPLDLSDLGRDRGYQRHSVYANAKRAQVELSARLAEDWPEVPFASMHPGWVATQAVRHSMPVFHAMAKPILRTPEQGADTIVWLLTRESDWPSGRFWFDRKPAPEHKKRSTHTAPSTREALMQRVFEQTEPFVEAPWEP